MKLLGGLRLHRCHVGSYRDSNYFSGLEVDYAKIVHMKHFACSESANYYQSGHSPPGVSTGVLEKVEQSKHIGGPVATSPLDFMELLKRQILSVSGYCHTPHPPLSQERALKSFKFPVLNFLVTSQIDLHISRFVFDSLIISLCGKM